MDIEIRDHTSFAVITITGHLITTFASADYQVATIHAESVKDIRDALVKAIERLDSQTA